MATYNQTAGWSTGSFWIKGSTSARIIADAAGDNISFPPLLGRINFDIECSSGVGGEVAGYVANPTTETLWIEKVIMNVETASSSSSLLSIQVCTDAGSSGTAAGIIVDATVEATTAGLSVANSSNLLPVAWTSTEYVSCYVTSSSNADTFSGNVSVFYCVAITT